MTTLGDPSTRLGRPLTLGVMMDRISEPYQQALTMGLLESTQATGANLLCFVGAPIPQQSDTNARHKTFELVNPKRIDGLVAFVGTLMHDVGKSEVAQYCRRLVPELPFCSIGARIAGAPSITTSNQKGIDDVVEHLVREHRRRHIAFVRGPLGSEEADYRFQAFSQALEQHGLAFDERLVAVGDFMAESGREAVRQFAQVRGMLLTDLDAIVASNDSMAIGVLSALEERGISVPASIAVTGFDDGEEADLVSPALTTVRQPLIKMGHQAARILIQWLQTGTEPEHAEIATELIVRRSCGCSRELLQTSRSLMPDTSYGFEASLIMRRQQIMEDLVRASRGELGVAGPDWQSKLLNAFRLDFLGEQPQAFTHFMEEIASKLVARGTSVQPCHDVIDRLRQQLGVTLYSEPNRRVHAEDVFHAAHVILNEIGQRGMLRARLQFGRWVRDIGAACNAFSGAGSLSELSHSIATHLPKLGLKEYYVVCYRRGDPEQGELIAARSRSGDLALDADPFRVNQLLPPSFLPELEGGKAFAVMPLAYKTEMLGHALFAIDMERVLAFDEVADAIGTGIRAASLAEQSPRKSIWRDNFDAPTVPGFRAAQR